MLEKMFKLKENNTTVKTEVLAGITTFMTMAYILAVNPSMLAAAGMDKTAVLMATCIASFIGTLAMAMLANYPFALAPGMGLNAYFAYTVCGAMGYDWKIALMAVFAEGLIFIVLSLTNVREAIFIAIPTTLKKGVSVGIGFFIAFLGLQDGHIVVNNDSTLVTIVDFTGDFHTLGIGAILALIGLFIISILYIRGVKGAILIGIAATWILGMIAQAIGLYIPDAEAGFYSLYPVWGLTDFTSLGETFGQCFKADFSTVRVFDFVVIILSFLFVDMFDTLGTLIGVANKAQMLDENDKLPRIKQALLADAIATSAGAVLGTSTTTTFVESSSGVAEGARTGLAAFTTWVLFFVAMFLSPVAVLIPTCATSAALIYVGVLMMGGVADIEWHKPEVAVPSFMTIAMMPFAYNISYGIAFGLITYVFICIFTGRVKEIKPFTWVVGALFAIMFFMTH